jgi:hypothetical protein
MHSVSIVFRKRGNGFRRRRSPCPVVLAQHLNWLWSLPGYPYGTSSIYARAFHCFELASNSGFPVRRERSAPRTGADVAN